MKSLLICSILTLAIACNSTKANKEAQADNTLNDGSYKITSVGGTDVSAESLTFIVTDLGLKIGGHAGCNKYFGSVNPVGSESLFSGLGSTKMFCDSKMKIEKLFLNEIQNIVSVSTKENTLQMNNANGETIITAVKE